jgi:hypothetical protein
MLRPFGADRVPSPDLDGACHPRPRRQFRPALSRDGSRPTISSEARSMDSSGMPTGDGRYSRSGCVPDGAETVRPGFFTTERVRLMKQRVAGRKLEKWPANASRRPRGSPPFFEKQVPSCVALVLPVCLFFPKKVATAVISDPCLPARATRAGRPRKGGTCLLSPGHPPFFLSHARVRLGALGLEAIMPISGACQVVRRSPTSSPGVPRP